MPGLEVTLTHPLLHPGPPRPTPFPQWGVLSAPVPGTCSVSLSLKRKCLDSHGGGCGASPTAGLQGLSQFFCLSNLDADAGLS